MVHTVTKKVFFTAACLPEALHAVENEICFHVSHERFKVILTRTPKSILDANVYEWNSYPVQHCMCSFQITSHPRMLYSAGLFVHKFILLSKQTFNILIF